MAAVDAGFTRQQERFEVLEDEEVDGAVREHPGEAHAEPAVVGHEA